jgi:tRNA-splicing endonuclease subunit Sen15
MPEVLPEREWVLPSHLREKWTLRAFGETFDGLSKAPEPTAGTSLFEEEDADAAEASVEGTVGDDISSSWRTKLPKRVLLATVDDDSTVVYYIIHDGIVKPRQN